MSRYIDADEMLENENRAYIEIQSTESNKFVKKLREVVHIVVQDLINGNQTANVREVRRGKWIDVFTREVYIPAENTTIALTEEKCSNCRVVTTFKGEKLYLPDYVCPNCGADMRGEEE